MKLFFRHGVNSWGRTVLALSLGLIAGCGGLLPAPPPPIMFYALEAGPLPVAVPVTTSASAERPSRRLSLIVSATQAAPGFDSSRIVFMREPQRRESYALSEWVDTPARMLTPLIVAALASDDLHRSVISTSGAVSADLRLDTELVRLQQNFSSEPSRVRLTLRATLVDAQSLRVLAWQEFDAEQPSVSEDARGGVTAAQQVAQRVLDALRSFCRQAIADLPSDSPFSVR
jgi:cholesterol transport system auxiliary component